MLTIYKWDNKLSNYVAFGSIPKVITSHSHYSSAKVIVSDGGQMCISVLPHQSDGIIAKVALYVHNGLRYVYVPTNFPPTTLDVDFAPDGGLLVTTLEQNNPRTTKTLYYKQV